MTQKMDEAELMLAEAAFYQLRERMNQIGPDFIKEVTATGSAGVTFKSLHYVLTFKMERREK